MDPLPYLRADYHTSMVIAAVAREAQNIRDKRRTQEIKGIGISVGNAVGQVLARAFRKH